MILKASINAIIAMCAITLGFSAPARAADQTTKAQQPLVVVEGGGTYDFGKICTDKPLVHVFKVTNPNSYAVSIATPPSGCGCTSAKASCTVIPPGGTANVTVTVDPDGDSDVAEGAMLISSCATCNTRTWLVVKATVEPKTK